MSSIALRGLDVGLNNCYYFRKANITINSDKGDVTDIKIINGKMIKELHVWKDNEGHQCKSIFMPGNGYREWCERKLVISEKYSKGTVRSRVGVCRYIQDLFGKSVIHLQKRSSKGGFTWEEVYWPNGQLMYKYSRGQKKGKFFNEQGGIWGSFEGELDWCYLYKRCVLTQRWNRRSLEDILRDGPPFKHNTGSFSWFDDKGLVQWQGFYDQRQRTGIWIDNYVESVFIRGVRVPKSLADAKPDEIDVYRVVSEKNAQLRAVLIEKIGIHRVINELKGEIVDEDKGNDYSLINIRLAADKDKKFEGDRIINLLKVKCPSTGAYYTLRVPPDIKSVAVARQWTFGVEIDSDANIKEEDILEFIQET